MLAPYQGMNLVPGMSAEQYSVEHDLSDIFYGPLWHTIYLNYAVISGAARDAGNTGYTTVLRPGLVMGIITASGKWAQWDADAVDGTEVARGILMTLGLNTQLDNANADRYLATIAVGGVLEPKGICTEDSATYGLARTGNGLTVRKHLMYTFRFADDFISELTVAIADR